MPEVTAPAKPTAHAQEYELKRVLGPVHLWAIAVGLVISGDYIGWNFGLPFAGPMGMIVATLAVTVLYITFIFSYTELSTAIPHAGGPYAYARRAFGPTGGLIAGVATLLEFVFAPPAIAYAIGAYANFLLPTLDPIVIAIAAYAIFVGLNCWGVKEAVTFELFVTGLAVFELLVYFAVVAPAIDTTRIMTTPLFPGDPGGVAGILKALPFAIWFYLAIEGVAMSAEETADPPRDIPKGYIAGILTLVTLSLLTLIGSVGVMDWKELGTALRPLPEAMAKVMPPGHIMTHMVVGIGMFGLIASFHGIIIGYSRQAFALARAGYLPHAFAQLHPVRRTPVPAVIVPALVGVAALLAGYLPWLWAVVSGEPGADKVAYVDLTARIVIMSVLGALVLYIVSMLSLFKLRQAEPTLVRPYVAPLYPIFPAIALIGSIFCLGTMAYFSWQESLLTAGIFVCFGVYYHYVARNRVLNTREVLSLEEFQVLRKTGELPPLKF